MSRIIHFSDVHVTQQYGRSALLKLGWKRWFGLISLELGGRRRQYALAEQSVARIAREVDRQAPDHAVLTGDLTQYSTEDEFAGAARGLGALAHDPKRITVIPGNHDRFTRGAVKGRRFERHFGHLLESDLPDLAVKDGFPIIKLIADDTAVIALDSVWISVPAVSTGRLGAAQLDALRRAVADPRLAGRAILVAVHHAPLNIDEERDRPWHRLLDGDALLDALPGPRFAVLHGHIHHRYHISATDRRPHLFCAGSSTLAGAEGYWMLETSGGRIARWARRDLPANEVGIAQSRLEVSPG